MLIKKQIVRKRVGKDEQPNVARHNTVLSPLERVRVKAWFSKVLEATGAESSQGVSKWLSKNGVLDNSLDSVEWKAYEDLKRKPSADTLSAVERAFGVEASIYNDGELPNQWKILEGNDIEVCRSAINEQLVRAGHEKKLRIGMPFKDKVAVFETLLIAPILIEGANLDNYPSEIRRGMNEVSDSYKWADSDNPEVSQLGVLVGPSLIIAVMALWHIATLQKECWVEADYYLLGVMRDPALKEFPGYGYELASYMWFRIKERGFGDLISI